MEKTTRYSKKRTAIYAALLETDTHPTAEWLYRRLKPEYPDLSLGTVYRNLARFKEDGEVVSVGVVGGQERFDANTEPHPHFVCSRCGGVYDLHGLERDEALDARVEEHFGHRVDSHDLIFHGVCRHCRAVEDIEKC